MLPAQTSRFACLLPRFAFAFQIPLDILFSMLQISSLLLRCCDLAFQVCHVAMYPLHSGLKCLDRVLSVAERSEHACISPVMKKKIELPIYRAAIQIAQKMHVHIYPPSTAHSTPCIPRGCSSTPTRQQAYFRAETRRVCKRTWSA